MVFWLVCAVLIAIALAFVLPPLLQRSNTEENSTRGLKEANVAVYRDQLSELEEDLQNGLVSHEQYEQDRDEIERRLLEDVAANEISSPGRKPVAESRAVVYAVALGLPILATALYTRIGNPNGTATRPTVSAASQTGPAAPGNAGEFSAERIEANVASLARRLEQNPNDTQGWIMLARSYTSLEKYPEAGAAYAKATALKTDDADLLADYAFVLAMQNGRRLQGQPVEVIKKALKIDPENPKALELAGSAAFEAGDYKEALSYWQKLLLKTPPQSELGQALSERINEARTRSGNTGTQTK
jgi:cytochrome c-type biogenesis protein CcmH